MYSKVSITSPKSRTSIRIIPLSSFIYKALKKIYPQNDNAYLLTGNENFIEPREYRNYYSKVLKQIGIQYINFHALRHTFATRLIEKGADYKTVSELLGHASVNMTLNLYVHPHMDQKRKIIELINKI